MKPAELFTTWRTSSAVARDVRTMDALDAPLAQRLEALGRTSPAERAAHAAAEALLWRARVCTSRGPLAVEASLKDHTALAAPLVVVLAAVREAAGTLSEHEVLARFGLELRDASWVSEAALVVACLRELERRRLVARVAGGLRARGERLGRAA